MIGPGGFMQAPKAKSRGWWEEYRCGCVSGTVKRKKDLPGYCPKHGEDRRHAHREYGADKA